MAYNIWQKFVRHKKYWWVSEKRLILWTSDGPLLGQLPYQHMYLLSCFDKNAILIYFVMSGAVCIVHITNFVFYFIIIVCNSVCVIIFNVFFIIHIFFFQGIYFSAIDKLIELLFIAMRNLGGSLNICGKWFSMGLRKILSFAWRRSSSWEWFATCNVQLLQCCWELNLSFWLCGPDRLYYEPYIFLLL